jgi:hypothetical protein
VQHIKRVKSMHGVILTLYRLARIDPTPPPPPSITDPRVSRSSSRLSTTASAMSPEESHRDQPRSKSAFAGLSLSKKPSPSIYRKDLCQAVAPLLLDPVTLSTSVSMSVKIPDDAFPTIKSVPGDMISFRYHLEVIIDLGGKLEGQLQSSGAPAQFGAFALSGAVGGPEGTTGNSPYSSWSTNVVNTENLRREKGVVYDGMEILVGTLDSTRVRGKVVPRRTAFDPHMSPSPAHEEPPSSPRRPGMGYMNGHHGGEHASPRLGHGFSSPRPPTLSEEPGSPFSSNRGLPPLPPPPQQPLLPPPAHTGIPAPVYVPRPDVPDMNTLSEKERVRWQEQVLLPSQPPQGPSEAGPSASAPSEGILEGTENAPGPSAPPPEALGPEAEGPSAPPLEEVDLGDAPPTPRAADPNVDKQELERQRLLNEASAPPVFPEDRHHAGGSGSGGAGPSGSGSGGGSASASASASANNEPSAPALSEEDEYGAHYSYSGVAGTSSHGHGHGNDHGHGSGSEPLPRYER